MKKLIAICVVVLFSTSYAGAVGTWTELDYPGANLTHANGISGSNIVGSYWDSQGGHGFLYDGLSWTTFDAPGAWTTVASAISGNNIVGGYGIYNDKASGFLYNGSSWTVLNYPGAINTGAYGIDGGNIVGCYVDGDSKSDRGFLFNGSSWTSLDAPETYYGSNGWTYAYGIYGNNIVGSYIYNDAYMYQYRHSGFLYNGSSWTTLDAPETNYGLNGWTQAVGISGNNIVGSYGYYNDTEHASGFLYDGSTWTVLDYPESIRTYASGISGNNIVGIYEDSQGALHGFIYTIPEPATVLLLAIGGIFLRKRKA